ncbi:ras-related protein rab-32 [Anaeramoeba ignava]|uniref:Ras-related protein rab-32 n=1 Tax=Anaeramoeba ignava TaxID=1746090 RepID=A0A9Q0LTM1_ANAIG|nr:ras-related protein rab-32 [Anaeramoeba ignava]
MTNIEQAELFKILIVGAPGCGKTSIIRRYTEGHFTPNYKSTIGVDFATKELSLSKHKITLQLWDIAGQERCGAMTHIYYKSAAFAIIVFDSSRKQTLEEAAKWKNDVSGNAFLPNGKPIPMFLFANKSDLEPEVSQESIEEFSQQNGFVRWFFTSAKEDTNIDEAMRTLAQDLIELDIHPINREGVNLRDNSDQVKKKTNSGCC